MLLSITSKHSSAMIFGDLLHKHPGRFQSYDLSFGRIMSSTPKPLLIAALPACCLTSTPSASSAAREQEAVSTLSTSTIARTPRRRSSAWRSPRSTAQPFKAAAKTPGLAQTPIPLAGASTCFRSAVASACWQSSSNRWATRSRPFVIRWMRYSPTGATGHTSR